MTTTHDRAVRRLHGKFAPAHRFNNFGSCLESITLDGIRGIEGQKVNIRYPITVLSGPNGSGKSTFAHAALCSFRQAIAGGKNRNLNQFFFKSIVDEGVFTDTASISNTYTPPPTVRARTAKIFRSLDRWRGYDRRPARPIIYIGLLVYLPKVERRDLSVYARTRLRRGASVPLSDDIRNKVNKVLGANYKSIRQQTLRDGYREIDIYCVERGANAAYSESNMGLGEGRAINIIAQIEDAPLNSLVVIDEPEIALHESAQRNLAQYLVDAVNRLGHQIIFTSHSPAVIAELPVEALVYLERRAGRLVVLEGVTSREAKALLTDRRDEMVIFVEDECAKSVLEHVFRRVDNSLINSTNIEVLSGGATVIRSIMRTLDDLRIKRVAVLDGDQAEDLERAIFKLPGNLPPEKEIFASAEVKAYLHDHYHLGEADVDAELAGKDPHDYFYTMANACAEVKSVITQKCVEQYVGGLAFAETATLVTALRDKWNEWQ
jgi:predicted ATPase